MARGYVYGLTDPREPAQVRYVGLTTRTLSARLDAHVASRDGSTPVYAWVRSLYAEGRRPLIVELESVEDGPDLGMAERRWISHFRSPLLLNVANGGGGRMTEATRLRLSAAAKARVYSPETRAKMSAAHIGHPVDPDVRDRIAAKNRGKKRSAETKAALSAALTGRKLSPEHIAKSAAGRRGKKVPLEQLAARSASWTEERRQKQGEATRARWQDPDFKASVSARIGEALKGRPVPAGTSAAVSASNRTRVVTQETRAKLSAAATVAWARKRG